MNTNFQVIVGPSSPEQEKVREELASEVGEYFGDVESDSPVDLSMYAGLDPECEFMLAVKAKTGNRPAFKKLWLKYRPALISLFGYNRNRSAEERVSEAAFVFAMELELFQPGKIGKAPEDWTFSYVLTGKVKNVVNTKILQFPVRKTEEEKVNASNDITKSCHRF